MLPILMYPAYRHGIQTPWGGNKLRTVFGKNIPDDFTGEALELSAIPGLSSVDENGKPLTDYIRQCGNELVGTGVSEPFPLLLKLIDAREQLSVQVHPDDEYAARVEGKLGKTEAWAILQAEPGAKLVYGIKPNTTLETLKSATEQGKAVEKLLHYVPVKPGEVYYIPAGTVHAIGAGIVLYEIQQSSDVTYRFYDWDRVDQQGKHRELHLDKALDVTNLAFEPKHTEPVLCRKDASGTEETLLDEKYFGLKRYTDCHGFTLMPDSRRFSILTAIKPGTISCNGSQYELPAGQTVMIPAVCNEILLNGEFFFNAYPSV